MASTNQRKAQSKFPLQKGIAWHGISITIGHDYEALTIETGGVHREIHYTELGLPGGKGNSQYGELWKRMLKMAIEGYIFAPSPKIKPNRKNNPISATDPDTGAAIELSDVDGKRVIQGFPGINGSNKETSYLSQIRKALKNYFGLSGDPFYQTAPGRFKPKFKITYKDNDPGNHDIT
jgi:hypothetical protein